MHLHWTHLDVGSETLQSALSASSILGITEHGSPSNSRAAVQGTHLAVECGLLFVPDFDQQVRIAVQDDEDVDGVLEHRSILLPCLGGRREDGPPAVTLAAHLDIGVLG